MLVLRAKFPLATLLYALHGIISFAGGQRASDNKKSNILIRLGGGQSGVTCQVHNSPNFTSTSSKIFDMWLACATLEEIAAVALKRAFDARYASGEAREGGIVIRWRRPLD